MNAPAKIRPDDAASRVAAIDWARIATELSGQGCAVLDRLLQDQEQSTESTVSELRSIANRTHRLATTGPVGEDSETLVELSHKCAVDAVVEGLRLGDAKRSTGR